MLSFSFHFLFPFSFFISRTLYLCFSQASQSNVPLFLPLFSSSWASVAQTLLKLSPQTKWRIAFQIPNSREKPQRFFLLINPNFVVSKLEQVQTRQFELAATASFPSDSLSIFPLFSRPNPSLSSFWLFLVQHPGW